jgi:peptidoglycan/xylan/chitin deacetylase (PgdA/CDA1 family)
VSAAFSALVLCYHAVSSEWPHPLSTDPVVLEEQLRRLLARGYRPARLETALEGGQHALHVTFDDAYRSVFNALPALERLHVSATVFACPGYADGGRTLDVPELAAEAAAHPAELETMDWDALRELVDRGLEIGSHTTSHPHLPLLGDAELAAELAGSREVLEDELARPCRVLAYPYGDEDGRVHRAARAAGYEAAFALPGRERPVNRFALPRVGVYRGESRLRFLLKTSPRARRGAAAALRLGGKRK